MVLKKRGRFEGVNFYQFYHIFFEVYSIHSSTKNIGKISASDIFGDLRSNILGDADPRPKDIHPNKTHTAYTP